MEAARGPGVRSRAAASHRFSAPGRPGDAPRAVLLKQTNSILLRKTDPGQRKSSSGLSNAVRTYGAPAVCKLHAGRLGREVV